MTSFRILSYRRRSQCLVLDRISRELARSRDDHSVSGLTANHLKSAVAPCLTRGPATLAGAGAAAHRESGISRQARDDKRKLEQRSPNSGGAVRPTTNKPSPAPKRKWGPELLPGPTLACWRAFDLATAVPVGRKRTAFACSAPPALLPALRNFLATARHACAFRTGLSPQPFRWSKRTGNHRSHRFTGVRSLFLRAGSGCDRIARGRNVGSGPKSKAAAPYSRAKDQDRFSTCPSASFEPGRSPARRLTQGPLSSCPCDPFSPHSKPVFPRSEDRVRSVGAP